MNTEVFVVVALALIILPFVTIPLMPLRLKAVTAFFFVLMNSLITTIPAIQSLNGNTFSLLFNGGTIFGTISLEIDPVSAWFILIINLTLINGALYGTGYMKAYETRKNELTLHWMMYVLFHVSMLWVCMLRNGFAFLVAWEIMTLSSLLLVLFDHHKTNTLKAGINYLVQMHIGVALLTIAFIWIFVSTGSVNFDQMYQYMQTNNTYWIIALFFAGFGIKAGFIPLHTWLPYAHPAAPSHISGTMSGVIVKMGIYGILRTFIHIGQNITITGVIVLIISAVTTLYGILNASVHRDYKKMLAFCTTENIGIIGIGLGLALLGKGTGNHLIFVLGLSAALLHTLNHSLYKSLLFFCAGNIYQKTHTRNMELLGGLIRFMPQTALIFLIGALAIGGLPPFNGFVSKFLVYSGLIGSIQSHDMALSALMIICTAVLSMAGGVSMLTFTKAFGTIFLGTPRTPLNHPVQEAGLLMRIPLYFIITIILIIGLFPFLVLKPVFYIVNNIDPGLLMSFINETPFADTITRVSRASLILTALIVLLFYLRSRLIRQKPVEISPTWGCGYVAPGPVMQYTGKSFSKSLAKLLGFITIENKKYEELKSASVFPKVRSYASLYLEFFEIRIFNPIIKTLLRFLNFFTFIHNGKIQLYVLYGFFFVILLIILSFMHVL